jgi:hypothetical protein
MTDVIHAFHEAGHGVIGVLMNLPLEEVVLAPGAWTNPKTGEIFGTAGYAKFGPIDEAQRSAEMVMVASGPESEMRFTGCLRPSGHHGDRDSIRTHFEREYQVTRHRGQVAVSPDQKIKWTLQRAATLVDQNWPWIDAVAEQLYRRRRLTVGDVRSLRKPPRRVA